MLLIGAAGQQGALHYILDNTTSRHVVMGAACVCKEWRSMINASLYLAHKLQDARELTKLVTRIKAREQAEREWGFCQRCLDLGTHE